MSIERVLRVSGEGGKGVNAYNELLDTMVLKADGVLQDIAGMERMLRACPCCRVRRAQAVETLSDLMWEMMDVMVRLQLLKEDQDAAKRGSMKRPVYGEWGRKG